MTINRVYIKSFGKLKDKEYILDDGLNVIFGNNESGKSTFLAFIRFMFYGAKKQRGRSLSFRDKYFPWNGENMEGELVYIHDGAEYSLSRFISASGRKAEVKLINKSTGEEVALFTDEVGTEIFGISETTFVKTMFISSEGTQIESDGETLAKISNVSQSGDEGASYQEISSRLKEMLANLDSRRGNAVIPNLQSAISARKDEVAHLTELRRKADTVTRRQSDIAEKLDNALKEKVILADTLEKIKRQKDYATYKKAEDNMKNASAELESIKASSAFAGNEEADIVRTVSPEEESIILDDTAARNASAMMEQLFLDQKCSSAKICGLICGVLVAVSLVTAFVIHIALLIGIAVFGGLCAFCIVSAKKLAKQAAEVSQRSKETESRRNQVLSKYGLESAEHYRHLKRVLADSSARADLMKSKVDMAEKIFDEAKTDFDIISAELIAKYGDITDIAAESTDGAEWEVAAKIHANNESILNLTAENAAIKVEADNANGIAEKINQLICEIEELESKLKAAEEEKKIIGVASEILDESYEEIKSNFAPRLAKATERIFNSLTGGAHGEITVNDKFEIHIRHEGRYENSNYFSSGTIQQLYFSLRLGIIEMIAEKLPLFIDDAFITYDDERFREGEKFLKEYSAENQIVFTTCHNREKNMSGAKLTEF